MIHRQDITVSYVSTVDVDSLRIGITMTALDEMILVFIGASNAF